MKYFLSFIISVLFCGCAVPISNYTPKSQAISEPPLNSVNTISVGDIMLRQGEYTEHEALLVLQTIGAGPYSIQPGNYLKTGEKDGVEFYYPGGPKPGKVERPALADNWSSIIIKKGDQAKICVLTVYGTAITTCSSNKNYKKITVADNQTDSFQQTLIYSGKIGNKINIAYREFSNNIARPAFNNNVEYDLSESKTIGYKGAQLEILEATNQVLATNF
jgi:hypothetical protein